MKGIVEGLIEMIPVPHCIQVLTCATPYVPQMHGTEKSHKHSNPPLVLVESKLLREVHHKPKPNW